jgi:hypothetical protein
VGCWAGPQFLPGLCSSISLSGRLKAVLTGARLKLSGGWRTLNSFFFFLAVWDLNSELAKQMLYHLSHSTSSVL